MIFGRLMRVQGESMRPAYRPGDLVWVRTPQAGWTPSAGDIVAARPAALEGRAVIKRVAAVEQDRVALVGEHPESCDSRRFGPVRMPDVIGPVAARVWPLTRRA